MPKLGDYLGQLLSEITIARMHADLESMRVAELYASHPLLRTMPVPHFRLPEVEIEVPVVIKETEEPEPDASPRGRVDLDELRKTFDSLLTRQLRKSEIRISAERRKRLDAELNEAVDELRRPAEITIDVNRVADELTKVALRYVREFGQVGRPAVALKPEELEKFKDELQQYTRVAFLKSREPPPRLHTLVATPEVREAGEGHVVTRLRLKVSEHGFEWAQIESEGRMYDRLVPE
jgi:hypothetical protein